MFTMPLDFLLAETGVFWDMGDCPIPNGISPSLIYENIKSALAAKGYVGKLSITAYSDMEQNPDDFESSEITLLPIGDRHKRRVKILEDFMFWAGDLRLKPFNLMIISRGISNDKVYHECFSFWNERNGNILLAQPEDEAEDLSKWIFHHDYVDVLRGWVNDVWGWESLSSSGGEIIIEISRNSWNSAREGPIGWDSVAEDFNDHSSISEISNCTKNIKLEESSSSTHGIVSPAKFPIPTPSDYKVAETGVFWDIGECPIPKGISPSMIYQNIKSALAAMGYVGKLSITAYSDMDDQDPADFESSGITLLRTGDRHKRRAKIFQDFMLLACDLRLKPFNLMIISRGISNDEAYRDGFSFLNERNVNILLAQPEDEAEELKWFFHNDYVHVIWGWESLSSSGGGIIIDISRNSWNSPREGPFEWDSVAEDFNDQSIIFEIPNYSKNIKLEESSSSTHGIVSPTEIPIPTPNDYKDYADVIRGWVNALCASESLSSSGGETRNSWDPAREGFNDQSSISEILKNINLSRISAREGPIEWDSVAEDFNDQSSISEISNYTKNIKLEESSSSTHGIVSPTEIPIPTLSDYKVAETGVFWDIGECPIPKGISPSMIYQNIKSALAAMGYVGKLSITAYSDMDDQDPADFESSGITLLRTGDKRDRLEEILHDMTFWAKDQARKPFNLLLIAEDISQEALYVDALLFWNARSGNILLAQPRTLVDYLAGYGFVREFWLWESLSLGAKPMSHRRLSKIVYRSLLRSHIAAKKLAAKTKRQSKGKTPVHAAIASTSAAQSKGKTRVKGKKGKTRV